MRTPKLILAFSLSILGLLPAVHAASRLEARVVDDATSEPAAVRVAITTVEGKFLEIEGEHAHVQYMDKRWCYVNGAFALSLPESGAQIEIRRGFETKPLTLVLTNQPGSDTIQKTFRLCRWIDMRTKGYFNGDIHAHLPVPREAHLEMQAEDLNALTLLHLADPDNQWPVNECFTGVLDTNSTPGFELIVGQEIQDFQMGHITLLGLTNLITGYPNAGGGMEFWTNRPHWDLTRAMRGTRQQNGTIFWSHMCSLPGEESAIAIALGLVDGIELITWNDPTQLPNHWEPWLNSGMSQAEFPVMRALDLYYVYLNAGFRLPIAAGTDKFYEEIPLGSNRTYVKVGDHGSYASWLAGVKAGRSFVSNGPILEIEAADYQPGDVVDFHETKRVKVRVRARSILPFTTLDIVMNGRAVEHKSVAIPNNPPVDGIYSMELETTVDFTQSGWLAARVVDNPDLRNPILPRGVSVFAHTAPIYFLKDGKKVREQASIDYLRKYVAGVLHWLSTHPTFANEEDRQNAERAAQEALALYRKM